MSLLLKFYSSEKKLSVKFCVWTCTVAYKLEVPETGYNGRYSTEKMIRKRQP